MFLCQVWMDSSVRQIQARVQPQCPTQPVQQEVRPIYPGRRDLLVGDRMRIRRGLEGARHKGASCALLDRVPNVSIFHVLLCGQNVVVRVANRSLSWQLKS